MTAAGKDRGQEKPDEPDREQALARLYAGVAGGHAIDAILAEDADMPEPATFWRWHLEDEKVRDDLARARMSGADRHVGEIVPIADDLSDNAASRKVRIDARVKAAQLIAPGKYGARPDAAGGGVPIGLAVELEAARRRAANGL